MGRKIVEEIKCDRCTRTEHKERPDAGAAADDQTPIFSGTFAGHEVIFNDLCASCTEVLELRWLDICRDMKKESPQRDRTVKAKRRKSADAAVTGAYAKL